MLSNNKILCNSRDIDDIIRNPTDYSFDMSDRFLATVCDTRGKGTTPQIACEFLRKLGVPPEESWPFDKSIDTEDKFFEKLPPKLYEIARDFLAEFDFKHEHVPDDKIEIAKALKSSPLGISVCAWFQDGIIYRRPDNMADNHFTTLISLKTGVYKRVFDSYESVIKDYEWNAPHSIIKRFYIVKKNEVPLSKNYWFVDIFISLKEFVSDLFKKML